MITDAVKILVPAAFTFLIGLLITPYISDFLYRNKLWKKTSDAKNNSDVVEVDTSQLAISKPTVVYFPGQITPDDAADEISRDLNDVKKIFANLPAPPQVYLWSHPEDSKTTRVLAPVFCTAVNKLSLGKVTIPTKGSDLTSLSRWPMERNRSRHLVKRRMIRP